MRSSARTALRAVLAILYFATSLCAQSPVKQPEAKTAGGSVSGKVTIKDKPAVGVLVLVRKAENVGNPWESVSRAMTDQLGGYRITNLGPGSYSVAVSTPAYVAIDSANRKSVVITEDDNVEGIDFSLVRGGVITGKVTDVEGRPVIQQQVEIYRAETLDLRTQQPQQPQQPQRPLYPARTAQTDDRGIYRMFGLTPGKYKVSAGRSENSSPSFSLSPIIYSQVFHPASPDPAKANVIEVSEGSEATNIDIALGGTVQMFTVSGRIINGETGLPAPQVRFGLHKLLPDRPEYVNHNAVSDARGEFTMEGLTPGKYGVFLFVTPNNPIELRAERTTFLVTDQDVTGVTIKLVKAATMTGFVILESDDKAAQRKLPEMKLFSHVDSFPGTAISASSPIGPDGSFRLTGLPSGFANFNIFPAGSYVPTGFVIVRVERDGVAMPRVEVKDGETVAGVKVFVRYGTSTIRGVVSFFNGTPPPGARVMIQLSKPGESLPYNRQAEVDARGQFLIDNVPAGSYELRTMVLAAGRGQTLDQKKEVSVTDGAVSNVTITIDVATLANP